MQKILFSLLLLLLSSTINAASKKALVGGTLIDGFGGKPIRNSVILIEDDRIVSVGQVGILAVPSDAEVISTEGMSVYQVCGICMFI